VFNPVIFLSRSILVAIAATFAVVAMKVLVRVLGLEHLIGDGIIGLVFAATLALAGVFYGHQQPKKSTSAMTVRIRLFILQFAIFLSILSALRLSPLYFDIFGRDVPAGTIIVPALVIIWLIYWLYVNVLSINEAAATAARTDRRELALMCLALLLAPYLLLVPGFSLAEMLGFDPEIIFSVFQYAPIMSASMPIAFSLRRLAHNKST